MWNRFKIKQTYITELVKEHICTLKVLMESQAPPCTPAGTEAAHSWRAQTVSTGETRSMSTESPSLPFIPKTISEYVCAMLRSH